MTESTQGKKLILCVSYGSYTTYPATKKNAMKIFNSCVNNLFSEVIEIANEKKYSYVTSKMISKVCKEVFETPLGDMLPTSKIKNSKEIISDLSVLMVQNNLDKDSFKYGQSFSEQTFEVLKEFSLVKKLIFSQKKPVKFLPYDDYIDIAKHYKEIMEDSWKEGVEEHKIAQHIINFVNEHLVTRDERFVIVNTQESYE